MPVAGTARSDRGLGLRPPNLLLLITDQQRYPCHWPDEPGLAARADAERAPSSPRTGLSFTQRLLQHVDVLAEPRDPASPAATRPSTA